jgi:acyl carrier protein
MTKTHIAFVVRVIAHELRQTLCDEDLVVTPDTMLWPVVDGVPLDSLDAVDFTGRLSHRLGIKLEPKSLMREGLTVQELAIAVLVAEKEAHHRGAHYPPPPGRDGRHEPQAHPER